VVGSRTLRAAAPICALALAAALGVAACGDDDTEDALTRAQFISQADAICDRAAKNPGPPAPTGNQLAIARWEEQVVVRSRANQRKLQALAPPEALQGAVRRYHALTDELLRYRTEAAGYRRAAAASKPPPTAIEMLGAATAAVARTGTKRGRVTVEVGFRVCGGAKIARQFVPRELQRRADAICSRANKALADATTRTNRYGGVRYPEPLPAQVRVYEASLPDGRRAASELAALPAPARQAAIWRAFVTSFRTRIGFTAQQLAAARAGDEKRLLAAGDRDHDAYEVEAKQAGALGLEVCGAYDVSNV
jgi:hypothetical protein